MNVHRSISEPLRQGLSTAQLWDGLDSGLIACWERGREKAVENPEMANKSLKGELILLPWKGGVEKRLKAKTKYGTYHYIAMWQGLRGEDLDINTEREMTLTCSAFDMPVVFTGDINKYGEP